MADPYGDWTASDPSNPDDQGPILPMEIRSDPVMSGPQLALQYVVILGFAALVGILLLGLARLVL